jgi:hypothetical protein
MVAFEQHWRKYNSLTVVSPPPVHLFLRGRISVAVSPTIERIVICNTSKSVESTRRVSGSPTNAGRTVRRKD